jgi:hypothetical protein
MTCGTLLATIFFPWPLAVLLAVGFSLAVPLLPVTAGIFLDTLYYMHSAAGILPLFTLMGALVTCGAYLVRSQLKTSIIGE